MSTTYIVGCDGSPASERAAQLAVAPTDQRGRRNFRAATKPGIAANNASATR